MNKSNKKFNRGMTYVELIVVLSIFAVLSSVVMFNYGDFQDKVDIKNLASDIALQIVTAQKSSLSGVWNSSAGPDWKPSYGVYFNLTTNPTALDTDGIAFNKKFIYFADLNNPSSYEPNELLNTILIPKNNYILVIDNCNANPCVSNPINNPIAITFSRPSSSAVFAGVGVTVAGSDYIQITIKSPRGATAFIKIYPSGRIQVN